MARKRKTRAERLCETFGECYRMGKARAGMTNLQVANMVGFQTQSAFKKRRDDPGELTLKQLVAIGTAFQWTDDDYMEIIRAGM